LDNQSNTSKKYNNDLEKMLKKYGKTVKDLAEYLGVDDKTVYGWQAGRRDLSTENIKKIAQHLGCTTDELLGHTPSDENTYVVNGTTYQVIQAIDDSGLSKEAVIDLLRTLGKHRKD
jgi:transcriptional regulator with XRE-family HTH domain